MRIQTEEEMTEQVIFFDIMTGMRIYKGLAKEENKAW